MPGWLSRRREFTPVPFLALYSFTWYHQKMSRKGDSHQREFTPVAAPERKFRSGAKSCNGIMSTRNDPLSRCEVDLLVDWNGSINSRWLLYYVGQGKTKQQTRFFFRSLCLRRERVITRFSKIALARQNVSLGDNVREHIKQIYSWNNHYYDGKHVSDRRHIFNSESRLYFINMWCPLHVNKIRLHLVIM